MKKKCKRVIRNKGHILLEHQVQRIVLPLHIAITMLPIGAFTRSHADGLAKVINIVFVDAGERDPVAMSHASKAGDVLCKMFKRVNDGKSWNTTMEEREELTGAVLGMDHYVRRMTTDRLMIAAQTVDRINAEAKAKGYGFLDKAPVRKI